MKVARSVWIGGKNASSYLSIHPQTFDVFSCVITPDFGTSLAELEAFYNSSSIVLRIGQKNYLEVKAMFVPAGCGIEGAVATTAAATTLDALHNGIGHPSTDYPLDLAMVPLHIPSLQGFFVEVEVTAAIAVAFQCTFSLVGVLGRES